MHCSLAHIGALKKPRRLDPVATSSNKHKNNHSSSQYCVFLLNCMRNPRVSVLGNAKLSTAFDVVHIFILLFAWDMPEIGFIGTAVSTTKVVR